MEKITKVIIILTLHKFTIFLQVHLLDYFVIDGFHYLIQEYSTRGTLQEFVYKSTKGQDHGINEQLARPIFKQLCDAVIYCHKMDVVHRWVYFISFSSLFFVVVAIVFIMYKYRKFNVVLLTWPNCSIFFILFAVISKAPTLWWTVSTMPNSPVSQTFKSSSSNQGAIQKCLNFLQVVKTCSFGEDQWKHFCAKCFNIYTYFFIIFMAN